MASDAASHSPEDIVPEGKRVAPLELFYDLVFVFAVTQVSHLLLDDLSWAGAIHATLALGVVWWAWNYTVWVTSEVDLEPIAVRLLFLAMMLASLAMAVAVPEAFGRYGLLFASSYIAIKVGRLLFLTVGGAHPSAIGTSRGTRLLAWFVASGVAWVIGGIVEGPVRVGLWTAALTIDLIGPLVMYWTPGHQRLPYSLWKVELSHLAERYETFVIIALGETIVLTGATVSLRGFDDERFAPFALAFLSTAALYWLYFDGFPRIAKQRLLLGAEGVHLARDAYMYLHVVVVAGVILSAIGDGLVIEHPSEVATSAELIVISAGPALYLFGHVLFRLRITGVVSLARLAGAALCVLVALPGSIAPALWLLVSLVGVLILVIVAETFSGARGRPSSSGTKTVPGTAPLTALAVGTLMLSGCAAPPPRPVTPDDAIRAAVADVGFGTAKQLFRGNCADRTCVLVADSDDASRIALIILESAAPYRVQASSAGSVGAEPATLDELGTGDKEFVYGRVDDARISKLELEVPDGDALTFDVATPGYAVAYPEDRGPVQTWRFLDAAGRVIFDSTG